MPDGTRRYDNFVVNMSLIVKRGGVAVMARAPTPAISTSTLSPSTVNGCRLLIPLTIRSVVVRRDGLLGGGPATAVAAVVLPVINTARTGKDIPIITYQPTTYFTLALDPQRPANGQFHGVAVPEYPSHDPRTTLRNPDANYRLRQRPTDAPIRQRNFRWSK